MLGVERAALARGLTAIVLVLLSTESLIGEVPLEIRQVPGGGEPSGPGYDLWVGRREIAVGPSFMLHSDAEADAGNEQGPFLLITQVVGEGTVMPDSGPYSEGTEVQLLASASSGWVFEGWEGDVPAGSEGDNPLTVVMDRERVITARFADGSSIVPVSPPCAGVAVGVTLVLVLTAFGAGFRRGSRRA